MGPVTTLPRSRPFTRADLDAMPDDGHRYEIVDGVLVVSPSPRPLHQRVVARLTVVLDVACPPDLEVLPGPVDVVLADDTVLIPDLLVARRSQLTDRDLAGGPALAVEVLSPSTRRVDLLFKRSRYEAARTGSYWVVDPDEPSIIAWDWLDGQFAEVARVRGEETFRATRPFSVIVTPRRLVATR